MTSTHTSPLHGGTGSSCSKDDSALQRHEVSAHQGSAPSKKLRPAALSPSRLKDFSNCPLKFRLRTIDQIPEPPSSAALRGTIVHAVLEHLFDINPFQRTEDHAQSQLIPEWETHKTQHPDVLEMFHDEAEIQEWLDSARPLIHSYFQLENPQYLQPIGREKYVRTQTPSGLAIHGFIDRLDQAPNGALRIVDYKTGKSPSPRFQEEYLFQMRFYAAALYFSDGTLPARTQLIFLKDGRVLTYDPTQLDVQSLCATVDKEWEDIKDRIDRQDFEARPNKLCDWCYFKNICPAFGGIIPDFPSEKAQHLLTVEAST